MIGPFTRRERGMLIFLCADFVAFLALFVTYIYLRRAGPGWPVAFHFASGLMACSITLFTLSGSFAMFFAARNQKQGNQDIAVRLIAATVAVWVCVLILEALEWTRLVLISEVTLTSNPWGVPAFGEAYFTLTGFYALHLIAGVVYLIVVIERIAKSDAGASALYVHFTNLVWLFVFVGIYLSGTDLGGI
jgi:heme/copper-type cytochrome/quinol oxidase subunit 3